MCASKNSSCEAAALTAGKGGAIAVSPVGSAVGAVPVQAGSKSTACRNIFGPLDIQAPKVVAVGQQLPRGSRSCCSSVSKLELGQRNASAVHVVLLRGKRSAG